MTKPNYTPYHLHSALSNPTAGTGADSVTNFTDYLDLAQEYGMKSFAFSEHGNLFNWIKKKEEVEKRGMKYIHASEVYLTKSLETMERDNYHYMLISKNYDGVLELNDLVSNSFKKDGHFYYNPRISFDELKNTSDNILMTSACLASPLWRMYKNSRDEFGNVNNLALDKELDDMLLFMEANRHRMFLEIQYHNHPEQIEFNQMLMRLSKNLKIPLIAGTDTHSLDARHDKARDIYLKSKGASYGDSDKFDLTFKTYDELVGMFEKQDAFPIDKIYLEAIENTNVMADMVEEFKLDNSPKYPKSHDNPIEVFKEKINEGIVIRGIDKFNHNKKQEYYNRIKEELKTYVELDTVDYMLLQKDIIDWCHENKIYQGYGRGSVNGSLIAYVLGITEMDSIKHNLNFYRFLNPERVGLADIDIDFPPSRRQEVIDYLSTIEGIDFSEIITFNTLALKGSIREAGRGLGMDLGTIDDISKSVRSVGGKDHIDKKVKERYPELFECVDILNGVVSSIGSHPSGFVVSPIDLNTNISTCYTKESKYKVSAVNMKELDGQNYVKLDILGLDNIEIINKTCEEIGIERLTPDNIDISDIDVWKSMTESTLGVFQMESESAEVYIRSMFSDETIESIKESIGVVSHIDMLSMANGAIRPAGESYRYELSRGVTKDNGHESLNEFLSETLGYLIFQEQISEFLMRFCGYSGAKADTVRRGLAKKSGTEEFLVDIEEGFIKTMVEHYGETEEHAKEILQSFLKVIDDASDYGFSINHSQPYSYTGFACAWLRYHYPLEFLTVVLGLQKASDKEKIAKVSKYARDTGIDIRNPEFGMSKAEYAYDKETGDIYKGVETIKHMNAHHANRLFEMFQEKEYGKDDYIEFLVDAFEENLSPSQLEILTKLDYFKVFGDKEVLLEVLMCMGDRKKASHIYTEFSDTRKKPLKYSRTHIDKTKEKRIENIKEYYQAVLDNPPAKESMYQQILFEKDSLGYSVTTFPSLPDSVFIVMDINKKFTPRITLYRLSNGEELSFKISKKKFYTGDDQMLYNGDVIQLIEVEDKYAWKMVNQKWEKNKDRVEQWIEKCKVIRRNEQ